MGSLCPNSCLVSVTADKFNEMGHSRWQDGNSWPCYSYPSWFVAFQSWSSSGNPGVLGFKNWLKHTLAMIVQAAKAYLETEHETIFRFNPQMFTLQLSKYYFRFENVLFLWCFTLHPLTYFFMNYIWEGKRLREHWGRSWESTTQIQTEQNRAHALTGSCGCMLHQSVPAFQVQSQYFRKKFISLQPCDSVWIN